MNRQLGIPETARQMRRLDLEAEQTFKDLSKVTDQLDEFKKSHGIEGMNFAEGSQKLKEMGEQGNKSFGALNKNMTKGNGILAQFTKRVKGLALRVFVFSLIAKAFRSMVSAMQEGLRNLAQYSKEYNGVMSDFKSQTETLKNSLATAFAPIVTAIVPYLTKLVSWSITATNYMAEFWAVFTGKGYFTKAKQQMIDYKKTVGKAVDETNKLASFDDINVLDQDSGGASGGALSGADAFEEMAVDESKFEWVNWLKEHMDIILEVAKIIGITFLAWKISSVLTGALANMNGSLLIIGGLVLMVYKYMQMWNKGIDTESLLAFLGGLAILLVGVGIQFGAVGVAIGLVVGGLALVVLGLKEFISTGELTDGAFTSIEVGLALIGVALTLMVGWIAGVVVAIIMLVVAVIKYKDEIVSAITKAVNYIKEHLSKAWNDIKAMASSMGQFIKDIWTSIKTSVETTVSTLVNAIVNAWTTAKNTVTNLVTTLKTSITTAWGNIKNAVTNTVTNMWNAVTTKWTNSINNLKNILTKFKNFWSNVWSGIKNIATTFATSMWNALKKIFNTIMQGIESVINGVIKGINLMINALNKLSFDVPDWIPEIGGKTFGFNLNTVSTVSLPRLETGGITNRPTTALIGESGREAVLPLENNTEWMDELASRIGGNEVVIKFEGSMSQLARVLSPVLDIENSRIGTSLVVQ